MIDKIEEIRKRHLAGPLSNLPPMGDAARKEAVKAGWRTFCAEADADRAFLLDLTERQRAEIEKLRASIQSLAESLRASLDAAIRLRDEARAENEKLRAENEKLHAEKETVPSRTEKYAQFQPRITDRYFNR